MTEPGTTPDDERRAASLSERGSAPGDAAGATHAVAAGAAPDPAAAVRAREARDARVFAIAWAVYLMAATGLTAHRVGPLQGMGVEAVRSTGRMLLASAAVGIAALWPLVRLSQTPPTKPGRTALADAVSILAPTLAVLWTMHLVVGWGWRASAAAGLLLVSWAALLGVMIVRGQRARGHAARAVWTAACLGMALGGPAAWAAIAAGSGSAQAAPGSLLMVSPVTGVYALTRTSGAGVAAVPPEGWAAALAPGVVAAALIVLRRAGVGDGRG